MENKHSFLDWKVPATEGFCDTVNCFFFDDMLLGIHPTGANVTVVEAADLHFI